MTFELGCNYWPRERAMYMWRELDLGAVRDELAHLRDMGFGVVRLFALPQDFLPGPRTVDAGKVDALVRVVSAAKDTGLRVVPTMLVFNMSGAMWWPGWMGSSNARPNLYEDPTLLRAQALLVETCARALAGDHAIRAIDLANEIDDAQMPRTRDAGWLWCRLLADRVRQVAPGIPIQIGAHLPSLSRVNHMRVDDVGACADEDCMHAYPLYSDVATSHLDPELVPFSCALTAGLAGTGRRTLMQEFGLCTAGRGEPGRTIIDDFLGTARAQYLASEEEGANYYRDVLERLIATGAAGAYAWCYADYAEALWSRTPFDRAIRERSFGLVRPDGSEKPAAGVFRALAARLARAEIPPGPIAAALDVEADTYYAAPVTHFARLYTRWRDERQHR